MTDCPRADVRDLLPDWVHGSLPAPERAEVEAHLAGCDACRAEAALIGAMRRALADDAPRLDAARIADAVRAGRTAAPRARRGWRAGVGGLALAASLAAVAVLARDGDRRPLSPGEPPTGTPAAATATPMPAPTTAARESVVAPGTARGPARARAQLSMGGGVTDLDEEQLEMLLERLDGVVALPDEAPAPVVGTLSEEEG
jgi:anti-sigma factor RsiW